MIMDVPAGRNAPPGGGRIRTMATARGLKESMRAKAGKKKKAKKRSGLKESMRGPKPSR